MKTQRPLTAESLLAAARRECPEAAVKERALGEMQALSRRRAARNRQLVMVAPMLLAAASVGALWWLQRAPESPSSGIVAEPIPPLPSARPSPSPPTPTLAAPSTPVPRIVPSAPPRSVPRHPSRPPPTLTEEVESLERVQAALDAKDPEQALRHLDRYRLAGSTRLRAEAQLLRIEALTQSGETEKASQLAQEFVASHPGNPLVDRARAFVRATPK